MNLRPLRALLVLTTATAVIGASGSVATADPTPAPGASATTAPDSTGLPPGWSNTTLEDGRPGLEWTPKAPVPARSAAITARIGDTEIPAQLTAAGTVVIPADGLPANLSGLAVYSGETPLADLPALVPGSATPPSVAPPAVAPKRYDVASADYDLGEVAVPGLKGRQPLKGHVVAPKGAPGARPVVLFLHGRHEACYGPREDVEAPPWPCAKGEKPVPSLLGYDYAQRVLAGRGYVTVSIDANAVNALDDVTTWDYGNSARSFVVREHLQRLAAWKGGATAPWSGRGLSAYDLSRTLLVGHSRGGDGVNQATVDSTGSDPWQVKGLVLLAPTNFFRQTAPTTPTLTLLPACDGDVTNWMGQRFTDAALAYGPGAALHTSVRVPGANHNSFNTEWTPGLSKAPSVDDGQNTDCRRSQRISSSAQRSVGAGYILDAADSFLTEGAAIRPSLTGKRGYPTGSSVRGMVVTSVGGGSTPIWQGLTAGQRDVGSPRGVAKRCGGVNCAPEATGQGQPHWAGLGRRDGNALSVNLRRTGDRGGITLARPTDLSSGSALEGRVIVRGPRGEARLAVRLTDARGRTTTIAPDRGAVLRSLPYRAGSEAVAERAWGRALRIPLTTKKVDVRRITSVEIVSTKGAARVVLLDLQLVAGSTPSAQAAPKISLGTLPRVREGSTVRWVDMPLTIDRPLTADVEMAVTTSEPGSGDSGQTKWVSLRRGQTSAKVPVRIPGNTTDDADHDLVVAIETRGAATVRTASRTVTVVDDDPDPVLTVDPRSVSVTPGGTMRWTVRSDRPSSRTITIEAAAIEVPGRPLRGRDLTASSRADWGVKSSATPLARAKAKQVVVIEPGRRSARVEMATTRSIDGTPRRVRVRLTSEMTLRTPVLDGAVRVRTGR